jgi:cholesterol oxidase
MAENSNVFGEPPSPYWISQGVEVLFQEIGRNPRLAQPRFDVLIVGSGYGGSIAAAELSGAKEKGTQRRIRVGVLERGLEYLPGMFPTRMSDLPGHVRFSTAGNPRPRGKREGLFDLRLGDDIHAVVANGLGGGSLINAGVMMAPHCSVLRESEWPQAVRADIAPGSPLWKQVKESLGAAPVSGQAAPDTIVGWRDEFGRPRKPPPKYEAMKRLGANVNATPLSIAMANGSSAAGNVAVSTCVGCGDCATGCNFGAKISHDVNLLVKAKTQGAEIFTGATVLRIRTRRSGGWNVDTNYTDAQLRERQGKPVSITARRVVLAAGTFGSTEILLRSRSRRLKLSDQLGRRFSGNGDIFAAIWKADSRIDAVADETADPRRRGVGPTITSIFDRRTGDCEKDYVVEELSVPGPLRDVFAECFTTLQAAHELVECDRSQHGREKIDPIAVDPETIGKSTAIAVIGRDNADGRITLTDGEDPDAGDGAVCVVWPAARNDPRLSKLLDALEKERGWLKLGGKLLPNPLWRFLPRKLQRFLGDQSGPLITVHPLGGCAMGEDVRSGVVDHLGRVFNGDPNLSRDMARDDLVVLDGSIVPISLGINPSLTIAVLATHAARELKTIWFDADPPPAPVALERRRYAPTQGAQPRAETSVEFVERMSGTLKLDLDGAGRKAYQVELTLRFMPVEITPWLRCMDRQLKVDKDFGRLRIFPLEVWRRNTEMSDAEAVVIASVSGSLSVLQREASRPWTRIRCSTWPWIANRALRDLVHSGWRKPPVNALALASRAGERRSFSYQLQIEAIHKAPSSGHPVGPLRAGDPIEGYKRLTYSRRACGLGSKLRYARPFNPLWQLATMQVMRFPCWKNARFGPGAELRLNLPYLTRVGVPLLRIVKQQDQVHALADLIKLVTYFVRLLLHIHALTFRQPDAVLPRNVDRLPGVIEGLPEPKIEWLRMPPPRPGLLVQLRLTRYPAADSGARPVLLIHGYSASGTTFAHPSVRPGLAQYLHGKGYDVWIVDLRTSAGLPTASMGWAFEDAAYADIPLAVDHILQQTGSPTVDIVAHCMGSAMTWMALLGLGPQAPARDWYRHQRESLPLRIGKLVASQVGPVNIFSPDNTIRAYVMRYVKFFAPLQDYRFRVEGKPGPIDVLLDRLLASLPYPENEFDRENPFPCIFKRTPWVGARHRIDALYARAFQLGNVSDSVLEAIDDFFGPLSVDTVSQAIHFATYRVLTDRYGANRFVTDEKIRNRLRFPILTIHGQENGLVDSETLGLVQDVLRRANPDIQLTSYLVPGAGHQDCLIGSPRVEVFNEIGKFLK